MNKFRNLYKILIGKPDEKRALEVHRAYDMCSKEN